MNEHKSKLREELFDEPFRIFRDQRVYKTAKRISVYWHYLARQNLYLKEIVARVKQEQIRSICEYCRMDVEL
jgi:hypothetical protein